MNIKLDLADKEHPSVIKMAEALIRFFHQNPVLIGELGEYLVTYSKHNGESEVMKGETLR